MVGPVVLQGQVWPEDKELVTVEMEAQVVKGLREAEAAMGQMDPLEFPTHIL